VPSGATWSLDGSAFSEFSDFWLSDMMRTFGAENWQGRTAEKQKSRQGRVGEVAADSHARQER
jgi:hypothetical protein